MHAAQRSSRSVAPYLDEALAALESVVSDGHCAGEVVVSVLAMLRKDNEDKAPLDLNELIQDVLG
jgi:flavin reductase (DIM6/NTAB) family NADH-FMN oxidoreductase RutF